MREPIWFAVGDDVVWGVYDAVVARGREAAGRGGSADVDIPNCSHISLRMERF